MESMGGVDGGSMGVDGGRWGIVEWVKLLFGIVFIEGDELQWFFLFAKHFLFGLRVDKRDVFGGVACFDLRFF